MPMRLISKVISNARIADTKCRAGRIHCIEMGPARTFCALAGTAFDVSAIDLVSNVPVSVEGSRDNGTKSGIRARRGGI